jgi:HD-GYP domain-containing protein (c-di-GMP phosphodiesterase class II)
VKDVGLAGLVYDLGMLLVPERIRAGTEKLADVDRARVQRHPIFSLSMIQSIQTVPPIIQLAALQHHERENGTGYPRGTRRDNVCDYARVLAVADSFAAATQHRTYRKPKLPYIAMEETLRSTTNMALWKPAVRALLEAAGLFPVGSYVKLSNGRNAHVLASNPKQLDRPTIQPLDETGKPTGDAVDLASKKPGELSVVRPLATSTG